MEQKPMTLPQMAGYFCTLEDFRLWLRETYAPDVNSPDSAADFVRGWCKIESRRDLLTDEAAAVTFRKMAADFDAWRKSRAEPAQQD